MLSGNVPFQPKQYTFQCAETIMKSIMTGEVSFDGEEWNDVSLSAKTFIQGTVMHNSNGILTVSVPVRRNTKLEVS